MAPAPCPEDTARDRGDGPAAARALVGRALPLMLPVLATVAIIAIATRQVHLLLPPAAPSRTSSWVIRLSGVVAVALGVVGLIVQRRRLGRLLSARGRPDPTSVALWTAGSLMAALTVIALVASSTGNASGGAGFLFPGGQGLFPSDLGAFGAPSSHGGHALLHGSLPGGPSRPDGVGSSQGGLFASQAMRLIARLLQWLIVLLLAIVSLWWLLASRVPHRARPSEALPLPSSAAEEGLEASLAEITRYTPDPRSQITRAYHRLLAALSAAGAGRLPHEAPHEHLCRALGPLGVSLRALHRLAELYVMAHFGARPVTERDRADAEEALEASLASLRATTALHGPREAKSSPEEVPA